MKKIAFLCPGQGAQYVEMGRRLSEESATFRNTIIRYSKMLPQIDIQKLIFYGSNSELRKTENAQVAIYAMSVAIGEILKGEGVLPAMCSGLSLGEYSALTLAGNLSIEEGLPLVHKRGTLMAQQSGKGIMLAVLGLASTSIQEVIDEMEGCHLQIANYNSKRQTIISGTEKDIEQMLPRLIEKGALNTVKLEVAGPFHSSYYKEIAEKFEKELVKVQWRDCDQSIQVIKNIDAKPYQGEYISSLSKHIASPVYWEKTINYLITLGITDFVEVGPGKVLGKINKDISRKIKTYASDTPEDLNIILKELG